MLRFVAKLLGVCLTVFGVLRLSMGIAAASISAPEERQAFVSRYIGSGTSGDAIDSGIYTLLIGLVFLILAKLLKQTQS